MGFWDLFEEKGDDVLDGRPIHYEITRDNKGFELVHQVEIIDDSTGIRVKSGKFLSVDTCWRIAKELYTSTLIAAGHLKTSPPVVQPSQTTIVVIQSRPTTTIAAPPTDQLPPPVADSQSPAAKELNTSTLTASAGKESSTPPYLVPVFSFVPPPGYTTTSPPIEQPLQTPIVQSTPITGSIAPPTDQLPAFDLGTYGTLVAYAPIVTGSVVVLLTIGILWFCARRNNTTTSSNRSTRQETQKFGIDKLVEVKNILKTVNDWQSLGLELGLLYPTLEQIEKDNNGKVEVCKTKMIAAWLKRQDNVLKIGAPSWSTLQTALRKMNENEVADQICCTEDVTTDSADDCVNDTDNTSSL